MRKHLFIAALFLLCSSIGFARIRVSHVFDDNMVVQRDKIFTIWGWSDPGEEVNIEFAGQQATAAADSQGKWTLSLQPMKADAVPQTMKITGKDNQVVFSNVLIGDIWVLGGQSNMEFDLGRVFDGDLEILAANNSNIRLLTIPSEASSEKGLEDIERIVQYNSWFGVYEDKGSWSVAYGEKVSQFSAIGYMFGKTIEQITGVPVGLIDASRGGTTLESWLSPEQIAAMPENKAMMDFWNQKVKDYDPDKDLAKRISNWEKRAAYRKSQGLSAGPRPTEPSPSPALDQNFPGASYNGYIHPMKGLSIKGVIFNHGFNNALGDSRPGLYALHFDALIKDWRTTFNDRDLPFGIVELTAGGAPQTLDNFESRMVDAAPFIREGQYKAYLNNEKVGYCCAYDQQVNWYHPQKKLPLGVRMARWALAECYGYRELVWQPAKVLDIVHQGSEMIITFDKEVKTSDDRPFEGFALAGKDRHFYPAKAEYTVAGKDRSGKPQYNKKQLKVSHPLVKHPVAVRYAWARNPLGNLVSDRFIPAALFRSDDWAYPEAPFVSGDSEEMKKHSAATKALNRQAETWAGKRKIEESKYNIKGR